MSEAGAPGHQVGMELNQAQADGGGGGGDGPFTSPYFASTPAEKKKAADSIEKHIQPDVGTATTKADATTDTAVKEFGPRDADGWDTAAGLKKVKSTWHDQVSALQKRLTGETSALRATNTLFNGTDLRVGQDAGRIPSTLDGY